MCKGVCVCIRTNTHMLNVFVKFVLNLEKGFLVFLYSFIYFMKVFILMFLSAIILKGNYIYLITTIMGFTQH